MTKVKSFSKSVHSYEIEIPISKMSIAQSVASHEMKDSYPQTERGRQINLSLSIGYTAREILRRTKNEMFLVKTREISRN